MDEEASEERVEADTTIPHSVNTSASNDALDAIVLSKHHFSDLGPLGSWTVSSAKPGFDIAMVQDASLDTYWQSDGPQPHHINIHFPRLVTFQYLSIYLNFGLDESYTPSSIRVMSGMGYHTLLEVQTLDFNEPTGWHHVDLTQQLGDVPAGSLFPTRLVQLQVLANHQNGKDTHVRAIKLHSPVARSIVVEDDIAFDTELLGDENLIR
ncbi:protein of unknown function [Taphrina deformans PYCC 5710]|uniref:DOC domain-containing protein n=1 Tax=Taphrina deformans (strain PYCC 5710 / ATCC 11124 / CBS 356.35 / IMI 108563 / JCM 9778 / NBRC 8474) TaxID=1097556 RepID=R4XKX9_TAPDE|nr:protein of unknown function [Taphrina deformans PYCC 5710]|eukprot:CCG83969.1 protein of unknown function [Taphrina deformans PYCC 5710]